MDPLRIYVSKNVYPCGTAIKGVDDPVKRVTPRCPPSTPMPLAKGGLRKSTQNFVKKSLLGQNLFPSIFATFGSID
jgi:hypothetical protein